MTQSGSFFHRVTERTRLLHTATLHHPMVQGIGNGSLEDERFRFYLEQDYQFLLQFVRVLAQTAASANDLPTTLQLSRLVTSTIEVEIDALRELYRQFDGAPDDLDSVSPAPTCVAYTSHLRAMALERDLLVAMAAFLPCHWGYHDIGLHLQAGGAPEDGRFAAWIEEYASDEYGELVQWAIGRFDEVAAASGDEQRERAEHAFELSSRYELGFWEMAWTGERWPSV